MSFRPTKEGLIIAMLLGVVTGAAAFAFQYGDGTSYFSKNPEACTNCHIMDSQFDSWQKASHHTAATCVDCHLPHGPVEKLVSKAENGWLHSKGFTMQDFHEPIFLRDKSKDILEENCIACHGDLMHATALVHNETAEPMSCLHCHRSVGHGPTTGMGKLDHKEIQTLLEKLK